MRRALLLPAKLPRAGRTKTRLSPPLSLEQAATLYRAFLQDSVALALGLAWDRVILAHSEPPDGERELAALLPPGMEMLARPGADLGAVLEAGFAAALEEGFGRAVVIGSDNPTLLAEIVEDAAKALESHDLVIGPSTDGGYYLLGMTRLHRRLFQDIAWSTDVVCAQTLERARELGLRVRLMPEWYDVDSIAELDRLRQDLAKLPPSVAPATRAVLTRFPVSTR